MKLWVRLLIVLSLLGLLSSLAISVFVRLGTLTDIGPWESVLGSGCFVLAILAFYVSGLPDQSKELKEYWRFLVAVLSTCPAWLRYPIIAAWLYGVFSVLTSMDLTFGPSSEGDETRRLVSVSGGFTGFYAMTLAMFYSATDESVRKRFPRSRHAQRNFFIFWALAAALLLIF